MIILANTIVLLLLPIFILPGVLVSMFYGDNFKLFRTEYFLSKKNFVDAKARRGGVN